MAGMRRSEVSALRWADVADAADGDGLLVTVRRSKTNQEGDVNDVRFVKGGVARAIPDAARGHGAEARRPGRAAVVADGGVAVHGRSRGRRRRPPGDRALGTGRAGVGADQPGRVDHRRHARRQLEDLEDGRALLGRGDHRARRRGTLPVAAEPEGGHGCVNEEHKRCNGSPRTPIVGSGRTIGGEESRFDE